jgi:hypothetical protein
MQVLRGTRALSRSLLPTYGVAKHGATFMSQRCSGKVGDFAESKLLALQTAPETSRKMSSEIGSRNASRKEQGGGWHRTATAFLSLPILGVSTVLCERKENPKESSEVIKAADALYSKKEYVAVKVCSLEWPLVTRRLLRARRKYVPVN